MKTLLNALMTGASMDETLTTGAKEVRRIGLSTSIREFRVTGKNGFTTTELYPNSRTIDFNNVKRIATKR